MDAPRLVNLSSECRSYDEHQMAQIYHKLDTELLFRDIMSIDFKYAVFGVRDTVWLP